MSQNDIQSELSYAYLHAVASDAGIACSSVTRHEDNHGIDARLTSWGPFPSGGYRKEVDLKVQLKATIQVPTESGGKFSFFVQGAERYNDLTEVAVAIPRILVVMFLPPNPTDWLAISENEFILKKCTYWLCLKGEARTPNATGQTVYLPKNKIFNSGNLRTIMGLLSLGQELN